MSIFPTEEELLRGCRAALKEYQEENARLSRENEDFRAKLEHQFAAVHHDLVVTLGIPPNGSVIEAVDSLIAKAGRLEAELRRRTAHECYCDVISGRGPCSRHRELEYLLSGEKPSEPKGN